MEGTIQRTDEWDGRREEGEDKLSCAVVLSVTNGSSMVWY